MKKNLLMKISFIFLFIVMLFLCFGKSNVYATSTEIIDDVKDNNTIMLDENLNADEKIMKYDAITGETTEVNMQEIKQLISNLDKKNLTGTANQPNVIGYDAISYWTNHTDRKLASAGEVKVAIPSGFKTKAKRLVLAPLDYNREVLCFEYECEKEGITYYFYFNAQTGEEENILKVIETTDSSKLM